MKKTFLLVVLMSLIGVNYVNAQSSQIATLSHENDVKVFYGATALKEAHEASVGGDVITLSSGKFNSCEISKSVTIQGAGFVFDEQSGSEATIIIGDVWIRDVNELSSSITIKGINFDNYLYLATEIDRIVLENLYLEYVSFNQTIKYPVIRNSIVEQLVVNHSGKTTYSILNSIIQNPKLATSTAIFKNSIINDCGIFLYNLDYSTFENCCILCDDNTDYLDYTCEVKNCVSNIDIFKKFRNSSSEVCELEDLFKSYSKVQNIGYLSRIYKSFELTDEAKQSYLGLDGKEVGIYGGDFPFDITSDFPRIVKCNVASKSTIDGKLSVDIQVKTGK